MRHLIVPTIALLIACTAEVEDDPFQYGGAPQGIPIGDDGLDDAAEDSSGDDPESEEEDTGDAEGEQTGDEGGSTSDDDGGPPATTSPPPSDDGGPPQDGSQPATGMYSHCLDAMGCGGGEACFQALDATTMAPMDGFCTILDCADPSFDCDPAPGGTATPVCHLTGANNVCALDCASGQTCPAGMSCLNFANGSVCV